MHAKSLFYSALIVALAHTTGCQSWQGASFPMQNATRVPPPGTGTYQVPSGYYNGTNTSSLNPASPTMQASSAPPASFQSASNVNASGMPNGGMPNGGMTASRLGDGGVVQAAFQGPPANASPGPGRLSDSASSADNFNNGTAASLSEAPTTETPSLQWQQFDGR